MPEQHEQLVQLITKHLQQTLTAAERQLLDAWLDERPENRAFLETLEDEQYLQDKLQAYHAINRQRLRSLTQAKLVERGLVQPRHNYRIMRWLPYVAASVLLVLVGMWLTIGPDAKSEPQTTEITGDIPPGGNKATLTLADGSTIDLSEVQEGIIVGDGITYLDGSGVLEQGQEIPYAGLSTIDYRLTTPKGGTYQITLPDGTRVWLNAASTLKYPSRFADAERRVEIEGEGYFAVAKDKARPFTVMSRGQEVNVLGTEFNISAYDDDATVETTLVEGTVQIINLVSNTMHKLLPGQQASTNGAQSNVQTVETDQYVAWKRGIFYFGNTPAVEVMKQIERWYDVEVVYKHGTAPKDTFTGEMERDVSLQTVLEVLKMSGIRFQLVGRKLVIE